LCYNKDTEKKREVNKMLAFMKYENGLKFKKVIFENENAAKLWLKQNGITNPNCYELIEVEFVKEDLKALQEDNL
jgi:hypothetical protein